MGYPSNPGSVISLSAGVHGATAIWLVDLCDAWSGRPS